MSAKFRERCSNTMRLINKMDEYEKNHPDEWCPISDNILKELYPGECSSQEGRDMKAQTLSEEEFEVIFDVVLDQYRRVRKKKKQNVTTEQEHIAVEEELVVAEK